MLWNFEQFAGNVFAVDDHGTEYRYGDLARQGDILAEAVGGRCLVFCLCTNTPGSILGYTSFLNHDIVPVMVDAYLDRELLSSLMDTYRPAYLWAPEEVTGDFRDTERTASVWDYALLKTGFPEGFPMYEELALLLTTSGSTGSPKLVRQSLKNLRSNTKSIVEYLHLDETERPITTLPMSYTYGLSIINSHLWVGATILVTRFTLMQKEFWRRFREEEATSFGGVPYIYEMLDRLRFFRMQLPALRTMTQAGGKLSPELHEKFASYAAEQGKHFVVMYGQTEATARMGYLPPERALEKCGSMGIAVPGGRLSLIDTEGREITEPDTVGELVYYGDNVTLGYAQCGADLCRGDERGGVLQTGDMARFDADGFFYIVGRKKRFLKIFGSRINLDETEALIHSAFPKTECVCAGVDDKMYIFLTEADMKQPVLRFVSEKTGFHPSAFQICVIDAIPRNEAGKILYKALSAYYDA